MSPKGRIVSDTPLVARLILRIHISCFLILCALIFPIKCRYYLKKNTRGASENQNWGHMLQTPDNVFTQWEEAPFFKTGKYGLLSQINRPDNVFAQREEVFVKDSVPVREEIVCRVGQLEYSKAPVGLSGLRQKLCFMLNG